MRAKLFFLNHLSVLILCVALGLSGCSNGNLFGGLNDRGDSSSIENLSSDAAVALQQRDYAAALDLYNRILAQDPNNSEALYGAAAAALGTSGLDLGAIIANVSKQNNGAPALYGLADLVGQSRMSIAASASDPDSLLYGVNTSALSGVINTAICRLNKIVVGATDQTIGRDDVDVLLNLAVLYVIRAVLRPLDAGLVDIRNESGNYNVVALGSLDDTACSNNAELIVQMGRDVVFGWALFNRAAEKLGYTSSSTQIIARLRSDVRDAVEDALSGSTLPATCNTLLSTEGISVGTFEAYSQSVLTTLPSGC